MDTQHEIIRDRGKRYFINCRVSRKKWPFNPPTHRMVLICPACNEMKIDITPAEDDSWVLREE